MVKAVRVPGRVAGSGPGPILAPAGALLRRGPMNFKLDFNSQNVFRTATVGMAGTPKRSSR
ncbi:MAG: hypothetical protein AAB297_03400, partial [Acidobacteriota bacterium]